MLLRILVSTRNSLAIGYGIIGFKCKIKIKKKRKMAGRQRKGEKVRDKRARVLHRIYRIVLNKNTNITNRSFLKFGGSMRKTHDA